MSGKWNIKLLPPTFSSWTPKRSDSRQIAVLMSGGVDSSVTAHLLKDDGWDVVGVTMKIPVSLNTSRRGCCGADAAFVCGELNIPHYFIDVTEPFEHLIIEPFRQSYARGETPNPCADCNTLVKFSLVWDLLREEFRISYLATGHYHPAPIARVLRVPPGSRPDLSLWDNWCGAKQMALFVWAGQKIRRKTKATFFTELPWKNLNNLFFL